MYSSLIYIFKILLTGLLFSSTSDSKTFWELILSHWILACFKIFISSNLFFVSGSVTLFISVLLLDISSLFKTIVGALIFIGLKLLICKIILSTATNELCLSVVITFDLHSNLFPTILELIRFNLLVALSVIIIFSFWLPILESITSI